MVSTKVRVFVDTNVLFSSFYSAKGAPRQLLELHLAGDIELVVSNRILNELLREGSAKLPGVMPAIWLFLTEAPPNIVRDPTREEVSAAVREVKPGDAAIWAAVIIAEPDYFVTGDRRFLVEARRAQTTVTVLTTRELIDRLGNL